MAELATIARPYAEALFRAAKSDLNATAAWLDELKQIVEDPRLHNYAQDPRVSQQQVTELVASVFEASVQQVLPAQARTFLATVLDNDRLSVVPEIAAQFHALKSQQEGLVQARITSAFPLDSTGLAELQTVLERKFGCKLTIAGVTVDPELIGGVRAIVGDEVYDTSVKAQLENMKMALIA